MSPFLVVYRHEFLPFRSIMRFMYGRQDLHGPAVD